MNTETEKAVRAICHELAEKMNEAASKHGKDKVNVCVFLKPHSLSSLTVNTNNGKYRFRVQLNMNGQLYNFHLCSVNTYEYSASAPRQYELMLRDIYADHAEIISLAMEGTKSWNTPTRNEIKSVIEQGEGCKDFDCTQRGECTNTIGTSYTCAYSEKRVDDLITLFEKGTANIYPPQGTILRPTTG